MALVQTPVCDFGLSCPDFSLQDATGITHTQHSLKGPGGLLVVFMCNHCPYVQKIVAPMAHLLKELLAEGVGCVAICSNDTQAYPEDGPEGMRDLAEKHAFSFPYLLDHTQATGRAFGAVCTPDFFGYNADLSLQYRGNFDHLHLAMQQIKNTGQGPQEQVPSMGCSIKWMEAP